MHHRDTMIALEEIPFSEAMQDVRSAKLALRLVVFQRRSD